MIAADDLIYLRPTAFVASPFGKEGQCARLAGGSLYFSALEIIARQPGCPRHSVQLVEVAAFEKWCASLAPAHAKTARQYYQALTGPRPSFHYGAHSLRFDMPVIMGILNVTPDSFSDGGQHMAVDQAVAAAQRMMAAGARILDIGGESTRPGATLVWDEDERARVVPVLEALRDSGALISIDTRKAGVMQAALDRGAAILNDVAALGFDERAPKLAAACTAAVVLMHAQGDPQTMQNNPHYSDAALDIFDWLAARRDWAVAQGIDAARIWLDPGIGFGKNVGHNLEIIDHLALYHALGHPLLLGASRKRLIGALSGEAPVDQRLGGSLALLMAGLQQGVQIVRVHDVAESVQALRIWQGLRDQALMPPL